MERIENFAGLELAIHAVKNQIFLPHPFSQAVTMAPQPGGSFCWVSVVAFVCRGADAPLRRIRRYPNSACPTSGLATFMNRHRGRATNMFGEFDTAIRSTRGFRDRDHPIKTCGR